MSIPVSDHMPEAVLRTFDGQDLEDKIGRAYLLLTTDADLVPRPCMLSVGEVLALDPGRLRLALWPGTRTGSNLRSGRPAVLCYVDIDTVLYIKGSPRVLPAAGGGVDRFEVAVATVTSDAHEGLPVTAPITYRCAGMTPSELLGQWDTQLGVLRAGP